jgi:hypothetical protein
MKFDYQQFEEHLEVLLAQDVISGWQGLGPGHYRIMGELDVWPKNKKYHMITDGSRGDYKTIRQFV